MRALLFAVLCVASSALAQYPSRAVKIVVTIPPGGAPDIAARIIGQKMSESFGQPVVIENRPGANGNAAAQEVARATPDGYTLILAADSLITINPHLYSKMPIDTLKDLAPVASLVANQFVLSVNPGLPVKTFQEFIDYAKKANPPLHYGSGRNGSQHQLTMELLKARAGIVCACALQGRGTGHHCDDGGRSAGDVCRHLDRAADQGGALACARHLGREALGGVSRAADDRRVLSRLRELDLARPLRAAGNSRRNSLEAQAGSESCAAVD
jgi:hypothetical protein